MKKINILLIGILLITATSCKKYLDINNNPNGPSSADPALYLPSILNGFAQGIQWDARLIGPYTQNFLQAAAGGTYDLHGYVRSSDFGGELWRNVYWKGGLNLQDMINLAREQKRWDIVGAGLALQAWGWQNLTDYHGEIIVSQAFDPARNTFDYDDQQAVYAEVKRLAHAALAELNKTGDGVGSNLFQRFDLMYKGDRTKWIKFTNAILAINEHHLSKKASYRPDSVITFVDRAFASNLDDAIVPFLGTNSGDANIFGPIRSILASYAQSAFIVRLMNGSVFNGATDPRMPIMLAPSGDGQIRGLTPGQGQSSTISGSASGVPNLWGTRLGVTSPTAQGRYLFQNNAGFPLMTNSMLQFIKAEAAFIKGDRATALQAYTRGINAHLDFVRFGMTAPGAATNASLASLDFPFITDASVGATYNTQRTAFLANPNVVPSAANLTLSHILLQKYIATWGYGFIETWHDLRKHDYDPAVFTSFQLPTTFFIDNNNQPAYRVRPRYNSEYIWNIDALNAIGGFAQDFHTKKMWIHQP